MKLAFFDDPIAQSIGKVPKGIQPLFHILGYATMPVVWAGVLGLVAAWQLSLGQDSKSSLVAIVLLPFAAILKLFVRRNRPPTIYADAMRVKSYSFPSSHAYAAALGGGQLVVLGFAHSLPILTALIAVLIMVIGVSRVHLGAHYPSDVVAGWLFGAVIVGLIHMIIV